MKIYAPTYSTIEPPKMDITSTKVFVASDVHEVEREVEDTIIHCFEYTLTEYDKDEYLIILSQNQQDVEALQEELRAAKILLGVE